MRAPSAVEQAAEAGVDRELARRLYGVMRLIASTEEALLSLFAKNQLSGTVHTSLGQEAVAAGVVGALDRSRDLFFSNHRCHGHFLAYSDNLEGMLAEIMGRTTGVCGGYGGSQHLHQDGFYSNGILGGMVPVAVGAALAEQAKRSGAIACVFLGDGAMAEGVVHEALNMAALWRLPTLFVIEDNGYAQSTPKHLEIAGDLATRGTSFGIETTECDGNDVMAVHAATGRVAQRMRGEPAPHILYLRTYRLAPHSKGDDLRDPAEIERERGRQPLVRMRALLGDAWCAERDADVAARLEQAIERCLAAPRAGATGA